MSYYNYFSILKKTFYLVFLFSYKNHSYINITYVPIGMYLYTY